MEDIGKLLEEYNQKNSQPEQDQVNNAESQTLAEMRNTLIQLVITFDTESITLVRLP